MKNLVFSIFFICNNLISSELVFICENNYSYKFLNIGNSKKSFYKYKEQNWIEIKSFKISDNKIDLFIPNFKYLGCADKTLPICKYKIRVNNPTLERPSVTEVVLNDCYIGTMGCNEYKKGLELNQSFCKLN